MPILPTVDFSPISNALGARGAAGQANFSEDFARLRDKEQKRQEVVGAIQGLFEVGSQVYGLMEQAKDQKSKPDTIKFSAEFNNALQESIANGETTRDTDSDGKMNYVLSPKLQAMLDEHNAYIDQNYKGFGRVQQNMKNQAADIFAQGSKYVDSLFVQKDMREGEEAYQTNVSMAIKDGIKRQDPGIIFDVIYGNGMLSEKAKDSDWAKAQRAYALGVAEQRAIGAADAEGLAAGYADINKTEFSEDEKNALRNSVNNTVNLEMKSALDGASQLYEQAKQEPNFFADTTIKGLVKNYPEWMRPAVEEQLRQAQSTENLASGTQQFNQDRNNPNLAYLKKQYETIQSSPAYVGDEKTRSHVMSLYEGLIGKLESDMASLSAGTSKADNDFSINLVRREIKLWTEGSGNVSGYDIRTHITDLVDQGKLTPAQASQLDGEVIGHQFPQVKPFLTQIEPYVKSVLGFGKKADKDLTPEQRSQMVTLSSVMQQKLADMVMEEGGQITPARIGEKFEQLKDVVTAKAFDQIRIGASLFVSREERTETAVARSKAALDSPAGQAAVFTDVNNNPQILAKDPEQFQAVIEGVREYEEKLLRARGIDSFTSSFEKEGLYDETGSKVYTTPDGKQYRFRAEEDRMVAYSRNGPKGEWKKDFAPTAEKEAADAAFKQRENELTAETKRLSEVYQGFVMKRDTSSAASLAAKKALEEASKALEAFRQSKGSSGSSTPAKVTTKGDAIQ